MDNWRDVGSGVMLFAPATKIDLAETQESSSRVSMSRDIISGKTFCVAITQICREGANCQSDYGNNGSDDSDHQDSIMLSIEEENLRVKQDIFRQLFCSTPPSATSSTSSPSLMVATPTTSSPTHSTFTTRIETSIASTPPESTVYSKDFSETPATTSTRTSVDCDEYDSDRTDFLDTAETPCPTKKHKISRRQTGLTSHHFDTSSVTKTNHSVRRRLEFGTTSKANITSKVLNPIKMMAPEYSPAHRWTEKEREFLCVLWRWFRRDIPGFAKVFNAAFGLSLSTSKIRDQYESYLRLHGPEAFLVYKGVMAVPFEDSEGVYDEIRRNIAATAFSLDIDIQKLEEETVSPLGRARNAKSRKTRMLYKSLVRRASQEEKARAVQMPTIDKVSV